MIKLIVFDFGGVIGSDADEWDTTFKKILKLTGLSPKEIQDLFRKHWPKLKIGTESMKDFWKDVVAKSPNKVSVKKLRETYNQSAKADTKTLNFIQEIKKKHKVKLAILMNESDDGAKAKIEKFNLNSLFDKIYFSAKLGLAKPQKEVFVYVFKNQKLNPNEIVFVDNQENNVQVTKSLGINSLLFTNLQSLKKGLSLYLRKS